MRDGGGRWSVRVRVLDLCHESRHVVAPHRVVVRRGASMHSNRSVGRGLDLVPNLEHFTVVVELLRYDYGKIRGAAVG